MFPIHPIVEAYFQESLKNIIKETGEGCPHCINWSILYVLQDYDKQAESELAIKYRNQCHEPVFILRPNDTHQKKTFGCASNHDWIVECVCKPCSFNGRFVECHSVYPQAAQRLLELIELQFDGETGNLKNLGQEVE